MRVGLTYRGFEFRGTYKILQTENFIYTPSSCFLRNLIIVGLREIPHTLYVLIMRRISCEMQQKRCINAGIMLVFFLCGDFFSHLHLNLILSRDFELSYCSICLRAPSIIIVSIHLPYIIYNYNK